VALFGQILIQTQTHTSPMAHYTTINPPLPMPSKVDYQNLEALATIQSHPHLFQIVMPINVLCLKHLLVDHPNQNFVNSVCRSLCEGFWPWANTSKVGYPITWDYSACPTATEEQMQFLREQQDAEISKGRYFEAFGPDILPGMYSLPIHAIPNLVLSNSDWLMIKVPVLSLPIQ
jgi:hypothetical protein